MLSYSPEYVAFSESIKNGIEFEFIDLSYSELLYAKKNAQLNKIQQKENYLDEQLLARSTYIEQLCKKQNCRDYNELWEKLFEINGLYQSTSTFVYNMIAYCYLSREGYTKQQLEEEGYLTREIYMSSIIKEKIYNYDRILVVTGGFHTSSIIELMDINTENNKININKNNEGIYLMPYSYEECSLLNGYSSGMVFPYFYNYIWEYILNKMENPYEEAVLYFISKIIRETRVKYPEISTADGIEALNMAKGLAILRDKINCGVYELLDGIYSACIKGEYSSATNYPIEKTHNILIGDAIGFISKEAGVPPIVEDYREQAKKYKLIVGSSSIMEKVLYIYTKDFHKKNSMFFHRLNYIGTDFCVLKKGPDFINNKDIHLIRETWNYKWTPMVETKLIELSMYGGTVKEAAEEIIKKEMQKNNLHSGECAKLIVEAYRMGFNNIIEDNIKLLEESIVSDGYIFSLITAIKYLDYLNNEQMLVEINKKDITRLLNKAFERAVSLITTIKNISNDEENRAIDALKNLNMISGRQNDYLDRSIFIEEIKAIIDEDEINASIEGAIVGLLEQSNEINKEIIYTRMKAYFLATGEIVNNAARFLKGLFSTARHLMLCDDEVLNELNKLLNKLSHDEFLEILPDLRLAFSFFVPYEIDKIAKNISVLYDKTKSDVLNILPRSNSDIEECIELERRVLKKMEYWSLRR